MRRLRRSQTKAMSEEALKKQLDRAELLLSVSRAVSALATLDEVLEKIVEITVSEISAERGSLFLNDAETNELYSRVAQGVRIREIRIHNDSGIAGNVFRTGQGLIVHDASADERFNADVDKRTGYTTKNILCVPVRTVSGQVIGVIQTLNKISGKFTEDDLLLLEAMAAQTAVALQSNLQVERMEKARLQEIEFLKLVSDVSGEIELDKLLAKVMNEATRILRCERSTLFLNDDRTNQLFSRIAMGTGVNEIRLPNHVGIAGAVYTSGQTINIPHAYADLRFNPSFDKQTGYFTRSILCVPVANKAGKVIGVTQTLNKRGGAFTAEDEQRLKAFTAQVAIALENAKLFDEVQNMKNYAEGMLESMSNGVITLDDTGKIATCNAAGCRIMGVVLGDIVGHKAEEYFAGDNSWIYEKIQTVHDSQKPEMTMDRPVTFRGQTQSINATVLPLISVEKKKTLGTLIMIEDISSEKRMKSTMARYMDPALSDKLMAGGVDLLGGRETTATVLFSDIRGFTPLTESLGATGTVGLLNEYFTLMVNCIVKEGGMLDKYIGDAIMAAFGVPIEHGDDEDRALRCSIDMLKTLQDWNSQRQAEGKLPVLIGIGLNTDHIVSGNIGSPTRMNYTLIGDGVNLASRLESACKQYAANLLISEYTFKKLKGTYRTRDIDEVIVKGKTEPVRVYEVLDYHSDQAFPNLMEVVGHFREGRKHFSAGSWDNATKAFQQALAAHPADKLSSIYIERCEYMKANPTDHWDGVWKLDSK